MHQNRTSQNASADWASQRLYNQEYTLGCSGSIMTLVKMMPPESLDFKTDVVIIKFK